MAAKLFRVIIPVPDIEKGAEFYSAVLGDSGERVADTRHYFNCGDVILALVDPSGHERVWQANTEVVYFAVNDLEEVFVRAQKAGCIEYELDETGWGIQTRPWGERSFYARDVFGNPICFVDDQTLFTGRG